MGIEITTKMPSVVNVVWELSKLLSEIDTINSNDKMCSLRDKFRVLRRKATAIVEYI